MSYDRAEFDYSTEEQPLPKGHAATHIGMFLAWAINNHLENEWHAQHAAKLLEQVRNRQLTGSQFFQAACKEQFAEKDLNVEGNQFAEFYYRNNAGERGLYFEDYKKTLAKGLPSFWHVADTWKNYEAIAAVISHRHQDWKNPPTRKWWQFWKKR